MKKFVFKAPFNSLSFGQVSYNLAKEFWTNNLDISIFPIGDKVDLSAYDKIDKNFVSWFDGCVKNRYSDISKDIPTLQLWHLRGSDNRPTDRSILYTFHELDGATDIEKSICGLHEKVIFSSRFSKQVFSLSGCKNVFNSPVGFDTDIENSGKKYFSDETIHFGLIGKWENRKNTEKIIKTWIKLFGNKKNYKLTCLVNNPFFDPNTMNGIISNIFKEKTYFNVTFIPRLKTNSEVNDLYNSIDIDLSGLSSGEGWNLPAFNITCLGKWSCVANHTSHLDWANEENSILINPKEQIEPYDGVFFQKGIEYNQGLIYKVSEEQIEEALNKAVKLAKTPNKRGEELKDTFSYKKSAMTLIEHLT